MNVGEKTLLLDYDVAGVDVHFISTGAVVKKAELVTVRASCMAVLAIARALCLCMAMLCKGSSCFAAHTSEVGLTCQL